MSLTPNFGFNIPTGTDIVNLLTQCYPNFTSLDSILKTIKDTGITVCTCTKVGTVFQLVRTDSNCNVIRFVATGNYQAGDTFTIDGVSVTATAVDGTSLDAGSFVINQSVLAILNGTVLTVMVKGNANVSINAEDVNYDNTVSGLTATDVQQGIDELVTMITSISSLVANLNANKVVYNNVTDMLDVYYNYVVVGSIRAGFQFDGRVFVSGVYYYPSQNIVHPTTVTLGANTIVATTSASDPWAYLEIPNVQGYTTVEMTMHYNSGPAGNVNVALFADETRYDEAFFSAVSAGNDYTFSKLIAGHSAATNIGIGFGFGANASFNITSFKFN